MSYDTATLQSLPVAQISAETTTQIAAALAVDRPVRAAVVARLVRHAEWLWFRLQAAEAEVVTLRAALGHTDRGVAGEFNGAP